MVLYLNVSRQKNLNKKIYHSNFLHMQGDNLSFLPGIVKKREKTL